MSLEGIALYSLVIFPTDSQIEIVKDLKRRLERQIGWFHSINAAAHITVAQFAGDHELARCKDAIRRYCRAAIARPVRFNRFSSFGTMTFFIAPDRPSQIYLDGLIDGLHLALGIRSKARAHLSIARQLQADKMLNAFELFRNETINIEFLCDAFYLRKFDSEKRQYTDIIEKIPLEGKPEIDLFSQSFI